MGNIPSSVIKMKKVRGIIITVTGYLYSPGKVSFKKNLSEKEYKDFQIYMAEMLLEEFVKAIDNQRYATKSWPSLSIRYLTYKRRHNLSLKMWEATGYMKKSLKVFKKGDYIAVGFKQSDVYPKSLAKVNTIARYLEYGGGANNSRPPARPLFRPITIYMRKNIGRYYKKYVKELKTKKKKFLYL